MDFFKWFEANNDHESPAGLDPRIDDIAVDAVVAKMADNRLNMQGLIIWITGKHTAERYKDVRDRGHISGHLLNIDDARLQTYTASVPLSDNASFAFVIDGKEAGSIELKHPPVLYDYQDKVLMASIIHHELQHAIDWVKGVEFKIDKKFNEGKYIAAIHEVRAFTTQLKYLLKTLGPREEVMAALTRKFRKVTVPGTGEFNQHSPFAWESQELLDLVQSLFDTTLNEAFSPLIGKAMIAASTLLNQQPATAMQPQKAAITKNVDYSVNYILHQAQNLCKRLYLKNFV